MNQDILERAEKQQNLIITILREVGINGCTNVELYDHVTKSLGVRLSELYEKGYYIDCTKIADGVYRYVLMSEPIVPLPKAIRAEDLLLQQIEEIYHGKITIDELTTLLKKNDLIISRKAGAHKRKIKSL